MPPDLKHLNTLDYGIVALYMLIMIGVGLYVARFNRKTSDYFKGGGHIPWGLSCISLFVGGFSSFMFVGAAGYAYRNGVAALVLFSSACPAYLLGYLVYGRLWRRTRIETPLEFLTRRYSPGTTYFYTVLSVIPSVLVLGISLYTLCIFVSSAFGFNEASVAIGSVVFSGFEITLFLAGVVILIYTMFGGLWAVMVTDALQFLVLLLVSLIVLPAAYYFLGGGNVVEGVRSMVNEAPAGYFSLDVPGQAPLFWVAYFVNIVLGYNVNWHIAQRYYSVPDERDTKRMALWCAVLSLLLPLMWITPVMASRVLFPDLAGMWPELAEPSEAAFASLALAMLPHGLLGVMVAAIFAAATSAADGTLNWLSAVLTKDVFARVYERVEGRPPSERLQLTVGKGCVALLGAAAIWLALNMSRFGGAFDVYLKAISLYNPAMLVPVLLGLVYTRTPWWSGMASFGLGVLAVIVAGVLANVSQGLPVNSLDAVFSTIQLNLLGVEIGRYELNTLVGVTAATVCFFGSSFAFRRTGAFGERITSFERDLRTPANGAVTKLDLRGLEAYRLAARLSIVIGVVLWLIVLSSIRNQGSGLNAVAGTLAIGFGAAVLAGARRYERRLSAELGPARAQGVLGHTPESVLSPSGPVPLLPGPSIRGRDA